MTLDQYIINTQDFVNQDTKVRVPTIELQRSYNSILKRKLEYDISFKESYTQDSIWEYMLKLSDKYYLENKKNFEIEKINYNLDLDLFQKIQLKTIASIYSVFEITEDASILNMAKNGFIYCFVISYNYKLHNVSDNLISSLCKITQSLSSQIENSVKTFGQNEKALMATDLIFKMTRNYSENIREGWIKIVDFLIRIDELDLLPKLYTSDDFSKKYFTKSKFFVKIKNMKKREKKEITKVLKMDCHYLVFGHRMKKTWFLNDQMRE
jgi:hypothetical protein